MKIAIVISGPLAANGIPRDEMSREWNTPDVVKKGAPRYIIRLVRTQMTIGDLTERRGRIPVGE